MAATSSISPALDHRIGEMRGADHHGADARPVDARRLDDLFKGFDDTGRHILCRGGLNPRQNGFIL